MVNKRKVLQFWQKDLGDVSARKVKNSKSLMYRQAYDKIPLHSFVVIALWFLELTDVTKSKDMTR